MDDEDYEEESGIEDTKPDSTDRKKQTHLRCERQRREAINSGYAELRKLLPSTMAPLGCKTTNASILYRACDYIRQLQEEMETISADASKSAQQAVALQIICNQYEELAVEQQAGGLGSSASPGTANLRLQMFTNLAEAWFDTFKEDVSTDDYASLTRSLLSWLEKLDPETAMELMTKSS